MTTNPYMTRHELTQLRDQIKTLASYTRQSRTDARDLEGLDRHDALVMAFEPDTMPSCSLTVTCVAVC